MTESEYVRIQNLTALRAVSSVLRDVMFLDRERENKKKLAHAAINELIDGLWKEHEAEKDTP